MSYDRSRPYPGVFHVGRGHDMERPPLPPPRMVPCWSFPATQDVVSHPRKTRGCMGMTTRAAVFLFLLFLLVFAAMGIGAYRIHKLQDDLQLIHQRTDKMPYPDTSILTPEKQVGFQPQPEVTKVKDDVRPAAHVIGRIHNAWSHHVLRWEPQVGRAFTEGGVVYQPGDGALLVNHTGLYHVYSRVELLLSQCTPAHSYVHTVFVRRPGRDRPLMLMEGHAKDACSSQTRGHPRTSDSYLAAALHLEKQDRVFVNVSNPVDLSHNPYANFFGLYKI